MEAGLAVNLHDFRKMALRAVFETQGVINFLSSDDSGHSAIGKNNVCFQNIIAGGPKFKASGAGSIGGKGAAQ